MKREKAREERWEDYHKEISGHGGRVRDGQRMKRCRGREKKDGRPLSSQR